MTRNQAKAFIVKREATLRRLKAQLAAERRLNNVLSNLAFLPTQKAEHLKELRKATTIKRKLLEEA